MLLFRTCRIYEKTWLQNTLEKHLTPEIKAVYTVTKFLPVIGLRRPVICNSAFYYHTLC